MNTLDLSEKCALSGIAVVATEQFLALQLRMGTLEAMRENIARSVYWPDFVRLAKAGQVPENWLPGALGRVVAAWAEKNGEAK